MLVLHTHAAAISRREPQQQNRSTISHKKKNRTNTTTNTKDIIIVITIMDKNSDPELRKKLLDDEDVEEQLVKPTTVTDVTSSSKKNSRSWTPTIVGGAIGLVLLGGPCGLLIGALLGCFLGKFGRSCVCKCMLLCIVLFVVAVGVVWSVAYGFTKDVVEDFTVTTPHAKYPTVDMTEHELDLVKFRVKHFVDGILAEQPSKEPLVITQDEINGFISHSDFLRGNAMVSLHHGMIKEEYSLPMEMFPGGHGRYFVGSDYMTIDEATETVEMKMETAATHEDWFDGPIFFAQLEYWVSMNKENEEAMLKLFLEKGSLFGQDAPESFLEMHQDLMEVFFDDKDNKDANTVLDGIERVSIQEGKIVVEPRVSTKKQQ
jgi:hypothetical protein